MSLLHQPAVRRFLSRHLLCRVDGAVGRFALTFDDGPSPRNTPRLLEVLAQSRTRATFFLIAGHVRRHPHLARALVASGHEVAVHGVLHLWPAPLPNGYLTWEVQRTAAVIEAATGVRPRLYRAPFGVLRQGQARWLRTLGYQPVLGDIYPADVRCRQPGPIVARVIPRLAAGSIVILHDASVLGDRDRGPTIAAVETIVGQAAGRGLTPATVSEMLRGTPQGSSQDPVAPRA